MHVHLEQGASSAGRGMPNPLQRVSDPSQMSHDRENLPRLPGCRRPEQRDGLGDPAQPVHAALHVRPSP